MNASQLGIRWTIGDVSNEGFEALRLSVWGAWRAFGRRTSYVICVNTVSIDEARARTGPLPEGCDWFAVEPEVPAFLTDHLEPGMAQGAAWKLLPLQFYPDRYELSLDNDCILWSAPSALRRWLDAKDGTTLLAEDVKACFGQFAPQCGMAPRNAGIRGLPPGFRLEQAMKAALRAVDAPLRSELDEQGLQVAAVTRNTNCEIVPLTDVSICSPFPPHLPNLGRCGAHFCGLNARDLGWKLGDRPASEVVRDHFKRLRPALYDRVGLHLSTAAA
ncbi:MAG: hypothetical protein QM784_01275 [Polyangiaceae bacterium]